MNLELIKNGKQCVCVGDFRNPCGRPVENVDLRAFKRNNAGYLFTARYEQLVIQEINKDVWNNGAYFMAIFDTSNHEKITLIDILYNMF